MQVCELKRYCSSYDSIQVVFGKTDENKSFKGKITWRNQKEKWKARKNLCMSNTVNFILLKFAVIVGSQWYHTSFNLCSQCQLLC